MSNEDPPTLENVITAISSNTNFPSTSTYFGGYAADPGFASGGAVSSNPRRVNPLEMLDLEQFTTEQLSHLRDRIERHLGPKPPKFTTVEEADAWMEKHYGQ